MTAPVRFRGVAGTIAGRVTIPVRVPGDLVAKAERIAQRTGEDRAVVLGDLVASVLPDALAEAARELLAPHLSPDAERPGLSSRADSHTLTAHTVEPEFTGSDLDHEDVPSGTAP